jgi:drug/metabolite transporter (DMT)-like permease
VSRYSSVFLATLSSLGVGLVGSLLFAFVSGTSAPSANSLAWGIVAGVSGVIGLGAFYYALSRGTMGIIAPGTALIGAGVPVIVAVIGGEPLEPLRAVGMAVALVAVVLISYPAPRDSDDGRRQRRIDVGSSSLVVIGGLGFAGFFICLAQATEAGDIWWALVVVRASGFIAVFAAFVVALVRARQAKLAGRVSHLLGVAKLRARALPRARLGGLLLFTGLGDLGGNAFFVLARQADAFSVAVVLSSLYPVMTTILAATFLRERLRPVQILGVVLATLSVPLLR